MRTSLVPTNDFQSAGRVAVSDQFVRYAFYASYYVINFVASGDLLSSVMTLPIFLIILSSLRHCPNGTIGQMDILALVYFLFFCIVPLQQVRGTVFVYGELSVGFRYDYVDFALAHALAAISYLLLGRGIARSAVAPMRSYATIPSTRLIVLIVAGLAFVSSVFVQDGFENVLAPRYLKEQITIGQIAPAFLGIQSVCTLLYFLAARKRPSILDIPMKMALLAGLIVMANPFNVARFALVGVWAPLLFLMIPHLLKPVIFYVGSLVLLIIVVPLLSLSTRFGLVDSRRVVDELNLGSLYTLKNLNVFELCIEAIEYTRRSGLRYGETFLSTIFTHIPRAWWPDKPVASNLEVGRDLVAYYRYTNENLAVPWFMDGYLDFWVFGAIAYSALAGLILFYLNKRLRGRIDGVDIYSLLLISNFLILARGTLAVVFSLFLFQVLFLAAAHSFGLLTAQRDPGPARDSPEGTVRARFARGRGRIAR